MLSCNGCKNRNTYVCRGCVGWNRYESNTLMNPTLAIDIDKEMKMLAKAGLNDLFGIKNAERKTDMRIKKVYFNDPVTVVLWEDGTKTIVRAGENEIYDPEKGLAMAIAKKALGNQGNYYEVFKKWLPEEDEFKELPESLKQLIDNTKEKIKNITIPKLTIGTGRENTDVGCITLKEYCVMNNLTKNKVYGMIKRKELNAHKDEHGYWLIDISE